MDWVQIMALERPIAESDCFYETTGSGTSNHLANFSLQSSMPTIRSTTTWLILLSLNVAAVVTANIALLWSELAAEEPASQGVSAYAPADDLIAQVDDYVAGFEKSLADETAFADGKESIAKDAHTLAVLGLALALHDTDHPGKQGAPALIEAAQALAQSAEAGDYPAAAKALATVKQSRAGESTALARTWNDKVAPLESLMKQVTFVNNRLRRGVKRPDKKAQNARDAAVLAVIAQAAAADVPDRPGADGEMWRQFSVEMRDAAGEVNGALRADDKGRVEAAMARLSQSCDSCHAVFPQE